MIDIRIVKPGQRVTVKYASPVTWARVTDNPYVDLDVAREMTVAFTAAGEETYHNMSDKLGHVSSGKPNWHIPAPELGLCVRKHKNNGNIYLAGINHDTVCAQFTIGGKPVTPEEETAIRSFLRVSEERERGIDFRVWTVEKLQNATVG